MSGGHDRWRDDAGDFEKRLSQSHMGRFVVDNFFSKAGPLPNDEMTRIGRT